jgi:hypothetical protein
MCYLLHIKQIDTINKTIPEPKCKVKAGVSGAGD